MKTIYCSPNFPIVTTIEMDYRPKTMTEHILKQELRRLIEEESPNKEVPINQAMDLLLMPERPIDKKELLEILMKTDEIYSLLMETKENPMIIADEDMIADYQEKTFYSFLIDLTNWLESR